MPWMTRHLPSHAHLGTLSSSPCEVRLPTHEGDEDVEQYLGDGTDRSIPGAAARATLGAVMVDRNVVPQPLQQLACLKALLRKLVMR